MSSSSDRFYSIASFTRASALSGNNLPSNNDDAPAVSGRDPQSGRTVMRYPAQAGVRDPAAGLAYGVRMAASCSPPRSPFLLDEDLEVARRDDDAGDNASVVAVAGSDMPTDARCSFSLSQSDSSDLDMEDEDEDFDFEDREEGDESHLTLNKRLLTGSWDDLDGAVSIMLRRIIRVVPDVLELTVADDQWLQEYRPATPSPPLIDEDLEAEEAAVGVSFNTSSPDTSSLLAPDGESSPSPSLSSSEDEDFNTVYGDEPVVDVAPPQPERGSLSALQRARGPKGSTGAAPAALRAALGKARAADLSGCGEGDVRAYLRYVSDSYRLSDANTNVVKNVLDRQYRAVEHRAARQEQLNHNREVVRDCLMREAVVAGGVNWSGIWGQLDSDDD